MKKSWRVGEGRVPLARLLFAMVTKMLWTDAAQLLVIVVTVMKRERLTLVKKWWIVEVDECRRERAVCKESSRVEETPESRREGILQSNFSEHW